MISELSDFPNLLSFGLNILQFLALIISIATFFRAMYGCFSKALQTIFSELGLGFFQRIRVMFHCRKLVSKKRAFIEYAILETGGERKNKDEWKTVIDTFEDFFYKYNNDSSQDLKYSIPNCTKLLNEKLYEPICKYFDFFSDPKVRKTLGIRDENFPWEMKIHIEEAYITPTFLLTGLFSMMGDDNWREIIKRYVSSAYMSEQSGDTEKTILANELYLTFAWFLWGPSYELANQISRSKLFQISYGDESNSFPAIIDSNRSEATILETRLGANKENSRYGALVSLDIVLFNKDRLLDSIRDEVIPSNEYFYEKIRDGNKPFLAQIIDLKPNESYKAQKYYCTAYVWLLFELDTQGYDCHPEKCVAFFEHANLADLETYEFLSDTLIDKCIKHFSNVFADEEYTDRKYIFVCAFNSEIEKKLREKYEEIISGNDDMAIQFEKRLNVNVPKHTPMEMFNAFDEFFIPHDSGTIEEVQILNKESVSDLARFYSEIYVECFPDPNERESFDNLLFYLKQADGRSEYKYHIVLLKESNEILGGAIFDYFNDINSAMIEFIAVRADRQTAGLGTIIYEKVKKLIKEDAYNAGKKPEYLFCEIDSPEYSRAEVKKYLYFWKKQHYQRVGIKYLQPALSSNQECVTGLWLAAYDFKRENNGREENNTDHFSNNNEIPAIIVEKLLIDYMKYAMQIESPEKNSEYLEMKRELDQHSVLPLSDLPVG